MRSGKPETIDLSRVAATHGRLLRLAQVTDAADVQAVLNLGAAVVLHAALEPAHLHRVLAILDPTVREELLDQHGELERDIDFLQELAVEQPGTSDVALVAAAVLGRLRRHLERDQRTLYGTLARLADLDRAPDETRTEQP